MREAGVGEEHVDRLTELALDEYFLTINPHEWGEQDVRRAYASALALETRAVPA
jgi:alcohol dehydrogenase